MKVVGLTWGIGMGKTTAADLLKQRGHPVVDTDLLARQVVEPGQAALQEIAEEFGPEVLEVDGLLKRDALSRIVFQDEAKRRRLEAITHPRIRAMWLAHVGAWRAEGRPSGTVVIPLLFETQSNDHFDVIVCVACGAETQHRRLLERGWSEEQIAARNRAQWPVEKKMEASDYVIWTEGSLAAHAAQLDKIFQAIQD
jgi:dephospho-CoA kinase